MDKKLIETSKLISKILRHDPESFGLTLEENGGWLEINLLIESLNKHNISITLDILEKIIVENDKQRLSISPDGLKIRANYGHSLPVLIDFESITPPDILYHGTATRFIDSIKQQGLIPKSRQYVHLSDEIKMANSVGQRHGKPVILKVQAQKMFEEGFKFYKAVNGVWLTANVPVEYIIF